MARNVHGAKVIAEMRRLRKAGMAIEAIAKKLRVSSGAVGNHTRDISTEKRTKKFVEIEDKLRLGWGVEKITKVCKVDNATVYKVIAGMEAEAGPVENPFDNPDFADLPELPEPLDLKYDTFDIVKTGSYGIISDIHIPCHDKVTLNLFVKECRRRNVRGIILNGDTMDCHEISDHDRERGLLEYRQEIEITKHFLEWLRCSMPKSQIVWSDGNHEARLTRYVMRRAPALDGLEGMDLPSWLHFKKYGVEHVQNKRVIKVGKLHVIHGDVYKGGGGVNPARWLYLRARSVALMGHFHRTSEHHERGINMNYEAAWSTGCACYLHPQYAPLNNWNNGAAWVDVSNDGSFSVENKRVFEGRIV